MIEYCLLYPIDSVENFLVEYFHVSKNKLKFYFDKKFLKRAFSAHSVLQLPLNFVNDLTIFPVYDGPEVLVTYEDDLFLVLNKPANIFSHPLTYFEKNNCLSFLRQEKAEALKINSLQYDRGLLYRLDFETSGVLIYIKQAAAYTELRNTFKESAKEKKYLCWVEGDCKLSGHFKHFFKATEEKGRKIRVSDSKEDSNFQEGELDILPKIYNPEINATLVEVLLGRGLRHQIRSQMAFMGHPIRGDILYGGKPAKRLYLHAKSYKILYLEHVYLFEISPVDFTGA